MPITSNKSQMSDSSGSTVPVYTINPLPSPITIPPVAQITADSLWTLTLNINLSNGPSVPGLLNVSFAPMDSSTGEVFTDQLVNYSIQDPIGTAANNSDLSNLLDDIQTLIQDYVTTNGLFGLTPLQASLMGD